MNKVIISIFLFLIYLGFSALEAQINTPTPSAKGIVRGRDGRLVHRKVLASEMPDSKPDTRLVEGDGQSVTVLGSLKKFVSTNDSFGYAQDGEFSFLFKGQTWLKGNYEKGEMVGSWKLCALDDPSRTVAMNFLEISNRVLKEKRHEVFPYYIDLEGNGKYEVFIVTSHGILILSKDSNVIFSSLMDMNLGDGRTIAYDRISKNGPFCFWKSENEKIWDSVEEDAPRWHFGSNWIFYIYSNKNIKKVFNQSFDEENFDFNKVSLVDVNNSKYKELHCYGVVAKWNPTQNQFVVNSKPTPINR